MICFLNPAVPARKPMYNSHTSLQLPSNWSEIMLKVKTSLHYRKKNRKKEERSGSPLLVRAWKALASTQKCLKGFWWSYLCCVTYNNHRIQCNRSYKIRYIRTSFYSEPVTVCADGGPLSWTLKGRDILNSGRVTPPTHLLPGIKTKKHKIKKADCYFGFWSHVSARFSASVFRTNDSPQH